jgi:hypothetical protein
MPGAPLKSANQASHQCDEVDLSQQRFDDGKRLTKLRGRHQVSISDGGKGDEAEELIAAAIDTGIRAKEGTRRESSDGSIDR